MEKRLLCQDLRLFSSQKALRRKSEKVGKFSRKEMLVEPWKICGVEREKIRKILWKACPAFFHTVRNVKRHHREKVETVRSIPAEGWRSLGKSLHQVFNTLLKTRWNPVNSIRSSTFSHTVFHTIVENKSGKPSDFLTS